MNESGAVAAWKWQERTEEHGETLFLFALLHQKFLLCWSVIEPGPQRYKAGEMIGNKKRAFSSRAIIKVLKGICSEIRNPI
jgi:hypothetical protein